MCDSSYTQLSVRVDIFIFSQIAFKMNGNGINIEIVELNGAFRHSHVWPSRPKWTRHKTSRTSRRHTLTQANRSSNRKIDRWQWNRNWQSYCMKCCSSIARQMHRDATTHTWNDFCSRACRGEASQTELMEWCDKVDKVNWSIIMAHANICTWIGERAHSRFLPPLIKMCIYIAAAERAWMRLIDHARV